MLEDDQVLELFSYIKNLDPKTRKVVALYTTQIATRAALHALKRSEAWKKKAPSAATVKHLNDVRIFISQR